MKKIAITGNIGTGKSSVIKILKSLDKDVINVDEINSLLLEKDQLGYHALIARFGDLFLDDSKAIDKRKMASIIFSDDNMKKQVEDVLHPLLKDCVEKYMIGKTCDVFVEVPILFEAGWQSMFDEIWLVTTSKDIVLRRLQEYRHMSYEDALARYNSQMSQELKIELSQVILNNDGDEITLYQQVVKALKEG